MRKVWIILLGVMIFTVGCGDAEVSEVDESDSEEVSLEEQEDEEEIDEDEEVNDLEEDTENNQEEYEFIEIEFGEIKVDFPDYTDDADPDAEIEVNQLIRYTLNEESEIGISGNLEGFEDSSAITLEEYVGFILEDLKDGDFMEILETEYIEINGREWAEVTSLMVETQLTNIQRLHVHNNILYIFGIGGPGEDLEEYLPVLEEVTESVEFPTD